MRYGQIKQYDVANGEGIRTTLFVTGCTHNCFNCFNGDYQDFNYGEVWTNDTTKKIIDYLKNDYVSGLSILGGEPMQNVPELTNIVRDIKKYTNKSIWLWSGYTFSQILQDELKLELLKETDVLIDGKFIQSKKDLTLKWRGSSNQRIIDVQQSLHKNTIVLYMD